MMKGVLILLNIEVLLEVYVIYVILDLIWVSMLD